MVRAITLRAPREYSVDRQRLRIRECLRCCFGRASGPLAQTYVFGRSDMINRRAFLGGTLSIATLDTCKAQSATAIAQNAVIQTLPGPLVWPIVTKLQPGIPSFVGHADTVLDVIGRIGALPSLVIFTEGNHLMVLSSEDIVGAFPSWARSQPQYANLDLTNIILVT